MERNEPSAGSAAPRTDAPGTPALRVRPTQQGTVYLWTIAVFSVTLLLLGENLVFLLGAFALGCAAVAWFLTRHNLRAVTCTRVLPRQTTAGAQTPLYWQVRRTRRGVAVGVEIEDRPARGSKPVCLRMEFPSVSVQETQTCTHPLTFGRRGVVDLGRGEAHVSSSFPLGLFRATRVLRTGGRILVRPREGRPTGRLRRRVRGSQPVETQRRRLWRGDDVIYGVREYRDGDDPRRIHWRSTARRGALVISEWRAEQGRQAVLVLGRGHGAGGAAATDFERGVSAAATIWRLLARERLRTKLLLGGKRELNLDEAGRGIDAGLDALAVVSAQGARRPRTALKRLADQPGQRTVIYVAAGPERGLEHELAAAAGRGGQTLVVRAYDGSLRHWVQGLGR